MSVPLHVAGNPFRQTSQCSQERVVSCAAGAGSGLYLLLGHKDTETLLRVLRGQSPPPPAFLAALLARWLTSRVNAGWGRRQAIED
eukprot:scaffold75883_cov31-Tisochrysis_lutea.AAC.1